MKLGIGLYRHMLNSENFTFAKQSGATHIIAHLTDYFGNGPSLPGTSDVGWGVTTGDREVWSLKGLKDLKCEVEAHGLILEGIENLDPALWYDVLLGGPKRDEQLELVKEIVRNLGAAGIPILGYNFSIAGVWGWRKGPFARGGAQSVGLVEEDALVDSPIPNGTVWNMIYNENAEEGYVAPINHEALWDNFHYFLSAIVPVAEKSGVVLAAHPDDPPMPTMRGHARLVFQPKYYDKLFASVPSTSNRAELCIGTVSEMTESDIYKDVDRWSKNGKIGYIHLRNVKGKVPNYHEVFIDEGDVDIGRVLRILSENGFDGVLIPDHTPQMECEAPWHAGMAYALGYMKGVISQIEVFS